MSLSLTQLLEKARSGDSAAAAEVFASVYEALRRIAQHHLNAERVNHTLQATALVNEAFVRMVGQQEIGWESRAHFMNAASQAMRRILVDHARARKARKRGGGAGVDTLDTGEIPVGAPSLQGLDLLALDGALRKLEALDERQARLVELRYFGGLTEEQASRALGVSRRTASADWNFAKAWLRKELEGGTPPSDT